MTGGVTTGGVTTGGVTTGGVTTGGVTGGGVTTGGVTGGGVATGGRLTGDAATATTPPLVVQAAAVILSVSSVTAALRASTRPSIVTPVVTVIDVRARMLPAKTEFCPSVAELPTCQTTLQACAPLMRFTDLPSPWSAWADLEDEDRARIALCVEGQCPGQPDR